MKEQISHFGFKSGNLVDSAITNLGCSGQEEKKNIPNTPAFPGNTISSDNKCYRFLAQRK